MCKQHTQCKLILSPHTDLLFCVVEIRGNIEDLQKSPDNVDQYNRLISLQHPIIQPTQVTMTKRGALDVRTRVSYKGADLIIVKDLLLKTRGEEREKLDVVGTLGVSHLL